MSALPTPMHGGDGVTGIEEDQGLDQWDPMGPIVSDVDLGECLPRWSTPRTDRPTYGPLVFKLAELLGIELMPWQRHVLNVALEHDPDTGHLVYREVRLTVPRQSGKTVLLLLALVHRCIGMGANQRASFTMQSGKTAREKMLDDFLPKLQQSPISRLFEPRRGAGSEAFLFENGSIWKLQASDESSGHGATLDMGVIDEAFAQVDGRVEQSMKPAMVTRKGAQLWIVSTAGTEASVWFNDKTDSGRAAAAQGVTRGVAYFEWSAPPSCDPGDESVWWRCMPALGHTIDIETIRADYISTPTNEFKRAYLNIRLDRRQSAPWKVIAEHSWKATGDELGAIGWDEPVVFGLEVAMDRTVAAVCAAGLLDRATLSPGAGVHSSDPVISVELVDHRGGTAWVLQRLIGLAERWPKYAGVVIDRGSPASTFIEPLRAKGVKVIEFSGADHARAAQEMLDAVNGRRIHHRNQEALTVAAAGAGKRSYGDQWLWQRRDPVSDVAPLVAATLAHGAALSGASVDVEAKPTYAY